MRENLQKHLYCFFSLEINLSVRRTLNTFILRVCTEFIAINQEKDHWRAVGKKTGSLDKRELKQQVRKVVKIRISRLFDR